VTTKCDGAPYIRSHSFSKGKNVLAFWPGDGRWYAAQVYGLMGHDQWKIYFPDDDTEYVGCPDCHLRVPQQTQQWTKVLRKHYVQPSENPDGPSQDPPNDKYVFKHDKKAPNTPAKKYGDSYYVVGIVRTKKGEERNKYVCKSLTTGKTSLFQMGYVQKKLLPKIASEWHLHGDT
jgi:hypothetical protein